MEDAANFPTSLVKSNLEGVDIRGLANISKPGFSTISEDGNDDRSNNSSPGDEGKTANSVSQDA